MAIELDKLCGVKEIFVCTVERRFIKHQTPEPLIIRSTAGKIVTMHFAVTGYYIKPVKAFFPIFRLLK